VREQHSGHPRFCLSLDQLSLMAFPTRPTLGPTSPPLTMLVPFIPRSPLFRVLKKDVGAAAVCSDGCQLGLESVPPIPELLSMSQIATWPLLAFWKRSDRVAEPHFGHHINVNPTDCTKQSPRVKCCAESNSFYPQGGYCGALCVEHRSRSNWHEAFSGDDRARFPSSFAS
jgi:hypothetical protein